jgi:hypothetical protein
MGLFDTRAALLDAIESAKQRELPVVTAFLPTYDAAVLDAVGTPRSMAGWAAFAGGAVGAMAGLTFPAWTVLQWPRVIVGGKPLLAWPTFFVIAFELMLFCAALAVAAAFVLEAWRARRVVRGYDAAMSDAAFGLLIACAQERVAEAADLMRVAGAVRCDVV